MCVCRSFMVLVVLYVLTLQVGAQEALVPADEQQRPQMVKLGTIKCDVVESTPVVFKGQLYRFEWNRRCKNFHFIDVAAGKTTKPFASGYTYGSAFVDNDVVCVTGTSPEVEGSSECRVEMFVSHDLENWEQRNALDLKGWGICNTSICKADAQYVLMFEIYQSKEKARPLFAPRFAKSKDLRHWELTPPECEFGINRYSAPHCLRYLDGWYYLFYLEADKPKGFETYVVRSKDLMHWESSPLNPVLVASKEDKIIANAALSAKDRERIEKANDINNSDIDFCEHQGKLIISYSWGNQTGQEFLAEAFYRGTLAEFLCGWFPIGKSATPLASPTR